MVNDKNKFGFLSVMFMVVGSTIGIGIFFKNGTIFDNTGSIVMSLVAWTISIFAVICIAITLKEIIAKSRHNHLGNLGWIKTFCSSKIYKGFRNFMIFFYLPSFSFYMPYYAIQALQDALRIYFGDKIMFPIWAIIGLSFFICIYFVYSSIVNKKIGVIQNYIFTFLKFIPLFIAIIAGLVIFGYFNNWHPANPIWVDPTQSNQPVDMPSSLGKYSGMLGVIASIPAIFFAFDGFYAAGGIYNEMKDKNKFFKPLIFGIIIIATIYVLISISLLLGSDGTILGISSQSNQPWFKALIFISLLFISLGSLGVVNGMSILGGNMYKDMLKHHEIIGYKFLKKYHNNWMVANYIAVIFTIFFIFFTTIGMFYFTVGPYANEAYYGIYGIKMYNFCDLISNWSSLFIFLGLGLSILGSLKKNSNRNHVFCGITAIIIIAISCCYELVNCIFDVVSASIFQINNNSAKNLGDYLVPSILQLLILFGLFYVCYSYVLKVKKR